MTITIRPAAERDLPAIASFARWTYEKAFGDGFSPEDLAHHLNHRLSDHYFRDAALADKSMASADAIYLDVWDRNDGARRLYERFGFEVIGGHNFITATGVVMGQDLLMVLRR